MRDRIAGTAGQALIPGSARLMDAPNVKVSLYGIFVGREGKAV